MVLKIVKKGILYICISHIQIRLGVLSTISSQGHLLIIGGIDIAHITVDASFHIESTDKSGFELLIIKVHIEPFFRTQIYCWTNDK